MEINALEEDIQPHDEVQREVNVLSKADVICHSCKKKGHFQKECRSNPMKCYNCDCSGHLSWECCQPKKKGGGYYKEKRNGDRDERSDLGKITIAIDGILTKITTMKDRITKAGF